MADFTRRLRIELPRGQSTFLWGPRKTGKTTYLRSAFPDSLRYDLLDTDLLLELTKRPALLRERIAAAGARARRRPIIIDEVQKVPSLMDEVHGLIENRGLRFILCGSSARKLKRGRANLLGGRAWRHEMHPLVSAEVKSLDLLTALNRGMIPSHYRDARYERSLQAYVRDYLKEEIFDEGLARNMPAFSRFLDAVGYTHGELTNYANIARDCGVDAKTVKGYYQILADTLLGAMIEPYKRRQERRVISKAGKFYLFDVGVAGALTKRRLTEERGEPFGRAFEHFILMEILAHRSYEHLDYDVNFWRTKSGLEVDFVLARGEVAIEVKGTRRVDQPEFRSLKAFSEEHRPRQAIMVCNERVSRDHEGIRVLPWREFLESLWAGRILA